MLFLFFLTEPAKKSRGRPKAGSTDATAAPAAGSEARKGMLGRLKKAAAASSPVNEVVPTTAKKTATKTATTKPVEAADSSIKKRGKTPKSPATEARIPPSTANMKTGASTSSSSSVSTGAFDDDESFDLKELLGEDFLSEGIENLLPNLDEDLAKLEANLGQSDPTLTLSLFEHSAKLDARLVDVVAVTPRLSLPLTLCSPTYNPTIT